jgi:putative ABC transport system permease protein
MNNNIYEIEILNLILAFIPVALVIFFMWRWRYRCLGSIYAVFRMVLQLFCVGYFLSYIFTSNDSGLIVLILMVMLLISTWIALRTTRIEKRKIYFKTFISLLIGGGTVLILITQCVLGLEPWFEPRYVIPLAGMIFSSAMTAVSLAADRLEIDILEGKNFEKSRNKAFHTALIPITNSLLAVGLVSLPGMMTGQILSGISPFIAARYQIMVMCMIFGSSGIATVCFLFFTKDHFLALASPSTTAPSSLK